MAFRAVFADMWAILCTETAVQPTLGPGQVPSVAQFQREAVDAPSGQIQRTIQGTQPSREILRKTQQNHSGGRLRRQRPGDSKNWTGPDARLNEWRLGIRAGRRNTKGRRRRIAEQTGGEHFVVPDATPPF
jgi:hypothetical protein